MSECRAINGTIPPGGASDVVAERLTEVGRLELGKLTLPPKPPADGIGADVAPGPTFIVDVAGDALGVGVGVGVGLCVGLELGVGEGSGPEPPPPPQAPSMSTAVPNATHTSWLRAERSFIK